MDRREFLKNLCKLSAVAGTAALWGSAGCYCDYGDGYPDASRTYDDYQDGYYDFYSDYVDGYDDTSEYHITTVQSDEAVAVRSGTTDWSQYLEVTGIAPAVASKVRIRLKCRYQHATNKVFVDPKAVIS